MHTEKNPKWMIAILVSLHVNGLAYTGYSVGAHALVDTHACHSCSKKEDASPTGGLDEYGAFTITCVKKEGAIL